VKRFIQQKFAEGALAVLLALLARMRDVNFELRKQLALGRRKRPPSETMHRLQMELAFWDAVATNDSKPPAQTPNKKPKKRGPRTAHPHGRAKQPEHLSRILVPHHVEAEQRICPCCNAETAALDIAHPVALLERALDHVQRLSTLRVLRFDEPQRLDVQRA
jgi:hypothetical protein